MKKAEFKGEALVKAYGWFGYPTHDITKKVDKSTKAEKVEKPIKVVSTSRSAALGILMIKYVREEKLTLLESATKAGLTHEGKPLSYEQGRYLYHRWYKILGLPELPGFRRTRNTRILNLIPKINELLAAGHSFKNIYRLTGVCERTVRSIQLGIPIKQWSNKPNKLTKAGKLGESNEKIK